MGAETANSADRVAYIAMTVTLNQIVPFGRSRREYEAMFAITAADLENRILGCADGPASFNAEMTANGHSVVSVDPLYQFAPDQIRQRFEDTFDPVIDQVKATPENWVWSFHRSLAELQQTRRTVIESFLADYEAGLREQRYRVASLPELPFADQEFGLAVCSHFLFLYSDLLDAKFHVASLLELCRVADEVRVFPLLTLDHRTSPHLEPVRAELAARGFASEVQTVDYELQKGGNQMLRVIPT